MESHGNELKDALETMTAGIRDARASLESVKRLQQNLDTTAGISLLSLKQLTLLQYLRCLVTLISRRLLGHSTLQRSPPSVPFNARTRDRRGNNAGDLVDMLLEGRIVLEKIDPLEAKLRYQIEKLVKMVDIVHDENMADDPLNFKPDPLALLSTDNTSTTLEIQKETDTFTDSIYRPPRLAPLPYVDAKSKTGSKRLPIPSALALLHQDPSHPSIESSSGLGGMPSLASTRALQLKRMKDFEEENFTRLTMKKSEARRRAQDEEALALGADLGGTQGKSRRIGGFEDEFHDVLRGVSRVGGSGDGYQDLRSRGKVGVLERSKNREFVEDGHGEAHAGTKRRSRFELETKVARKKFKGR